VHGSAESGERRRVSASAPVSALSAHESSLPPLALLLLRCPLTPPQQTHPTHTHPNMTSELKTADEQLRELAKEQKR
jgi:hypothetical protein